MFKVPSEPIKMFLSHKLCIIFFKSLIRSKTSPLGRITSSPKHRSLAFPYLSTFIPPAFVDKLPPIIQEPLAPRFKGKNKLFLSTKLCISDKITPDSSLRVFAFVSIDIILFGFSVLITIELEFLIGVAPPHKPVLPPFGVLLEV